MKNSVRFAVERPGMFLLVLGCGISFGAVVACLIALMGVL